jgi:hypothetical protein
MIVPLVSSNSSYCVLLLNINHSIIVVYRNDILPLCTHSTCGSPLSYADFIGFLKCGEFTILNQLDLDYNLCLNDLQITDRCAFRQGIRILLDKTGYASCSVFR